jgi:hypothetical protein
MIILSRSAPAIQDCTAGVIPDPHPKSSGFGVTCEFFERELGLHLVPN